MNFLKTLAKHVLRVYDDALYGLIRIFENRSSGSDVLANTPLISVITPTYNTDHDFLRVMIESVINQHYQNWELILVDDHSSDSKVRAIIEGYAARDNRIRYVFLQENHHIAGATNVGINKARGEYIGLIDHDDIIYPNTLHEIAKAINQNPDVKFMYTDEDKILGKKRIQPFFKPAWNLGLLHCVNYVTHFAVIKKSTLDEVGYEDAQYNGAQDWELFLRIGRHVNGNEIIHIPRILYSWRIHALSTSSSLDAKPYVLDAQLKAVREDIKQRNLTDVVERDKRYPGQLSVNHNKGVHGLNFKDLRNLLGFKIAVFILVSSRMALSRHIYRTTSYDRIR